VLLWTLCSLLSGCEWPYLLRQGSEQVALLVRRRPVAEVLGDPGLSIRRREQIERVAAVKRFARERLGLADPGSYEHLCHLERDALSWVVSACPDDSLEPHTWWFPLVGHVPYKGFFDPGEAREEAHRLEQLGLVPLVRPVEAFSLLGWMPDPLYSPMLDGPAERLVEVILHELTHATVFVPGRSDFNEALASFVGRQGARAFWMASMTGPLAELDRQERERDRRTTVMRALVRDLESLFREPWNRPTRLSLARARLRRADAEMHPNENSGPPLDVADASLFRLYDPGPWDFESLLARENHDLRRFIRSIGQALARTEDVTHLLGTWQKPGP